MQSARSRMDQWDRFYTDPGLARRYVGDILQRYAGLSGDRAFFIEPAAGQGAFVTALRDRNCHVVAMDIAPAATGIKTGDFFASHDLYSHSDNRSSGLVVTIGNPPFGTNASLAVKFFNRAAIHSDLIAFIVPRTFNKVSVQARLDRYFHLRHNEIVPEQSFIWGGNPHHVPCVWQIWEKSQTPRPRPVTPYVADLIEYTSKQRATFAMRRVGFYAGCVMTEGLQSLSETTHYFLRDLQAGVIDLLERIDWRLLASQTAGVRSLSKHEIACHLYAHWQARMAVSSI